MDEDVKAQFIADEAVVKTISDEVLRLRERLHKVEGELPVVKLNMSELTLETKSQTPLIRQVHTAVLGPEGLGEQVRKHDRYLQTQTRILLGILIPLLGIIASATCYAAFSKRAPITPAEAKQFVDILKASNQ
jgi:hypothetical protein